jgi:hypothetical protein|tara:strand:- start:230 stop:373 length:144 start_codon:yes stop_codon:yes gene_type:complete
VLQFPRTEPEGSLAIQEYPERLSGGLFSGEAIEFLLSSPVWLPYYLC